MYSQILIIISSLIGVIGTVYAVLSILSLQIKDVIKTVTWGGLESRDQEILVQREQARVGIPLIILGWIWQTIFSLIKVDSCTKFIASGILIVFSVVAIVLTMKSMNRKFRENYKAERYGTKSS